MYSLRKKTSQYTEITQMYMFLRVTNAYSWRKRKYHTSSLILFNKGPWPGEIWSNRHPEQLSPPQLPFSVFFIISILYRLQNFNESSLPNLWVFVGFSNCWERQPVPMVLQCPLHHIRTCLGLSVLPYQETESHKACQFYHLCENIFPGSNSRSVSVFCLNVYVNDCHTQLSVFQPPRGRVQGPLTAARESYVIGQLSWISFRGDSLAMRDQSTLLELENVAPPNADCVLVFLANSDTKIQGTKMLGVLCWDWLLVGGICSPRTDNWHTVFFSTATPIQIDTLICLSLSLKTYIQIFHLTAKTLRLMG